MEDLKCYSKELQVIEMGGHHGVFLVRVWNNDNIKRLNWQPLLRINNEEKCITSIETASPFSSFLKHQKGWGARNTHPGSVFYHPRWNRRLNWDAMLALWESTFQLSSEWGGALFMTQEGKPLPLIREYWAQSLLLFLIPLTQSRRHKVYHLAQEWGTSGYQPPSQLP